MLFINCKFSTYAIKLDKRLIKIKMIPITKKSTTKRNILISMLALLAIGFGALTYVYVFNGNIFGWSNNINSNSPIDYKEPSQQQKNDGTSAKEDFVDKYYPKTDSNPDATSDGDSTSPTNIGVIISSTTQNSELFQIRTILQTLNPGKCKLTMTQEDQDSIVRTVETQNLGSYSTCKGFDIAMIDLRPGSWNTTVEYTSDSESGTTSQQIEVK